MIREQSSHYPLSRGNYSAWQLPVAITGASSSVIGGPAVLSTGSRIIEAL
jgi:hypothetical protein